MTGLEWTSLRDLYRHCGLVTTQGSRAPFHWSMVIGHHRHPLARGRWRQRGVNAAVAIGLHARVRFRFWGFILGGPHSMPSAARAMHAASPRTAHRHTHSPSPWLDLPHVCVLNRSTSTSPLPSGARAGRGLAVWYA